MVMFIQREISQRLVVSPPEGVGRRILSDAVWIQAGTIFNVPQTGNVYREDLRSDLELVSFRGDSFPLRFSIDYTNV